MFLSDPFTPISDAKSRRRQGASNQVNQRQTHARGNDESPGCVEDTTKLMR